MFLKELFEADAEDLKPGETREIEVKLADLKKIENKIKDTEKFFQSMKYQNVPASRSLLKKFEEFKTEIENKIKEYNDILKSEREKEQEENPELKDLIEKIKKNCSEYLKAVEDAGGKYIFRGSKTSKIVYIGRSQDARQPKDSNPLEQEVFDEVMRSLGIKTTRSNSIFCSPSYSQASGYATDYPHVIFPINGFNYLYTIEDDLIMRSGHMLKYASEEKMNAYIDELKKFISANYSKSEQQEKQKYFKNLKRNDSIKIPNSENIGAVAYLDLDKEKVEIYYNGEYTWHSLNDIIAANPEKNISVDEKVVRTYSQFDIEDYELRSLFEFVFDAYYTSEAKLRELIRKTSYNLNNIQNLPENLKVGKEMYFSLIDMDKINTELQPSDSNLSEFLKNRSGEICISGTYYALRADKFRETIEKNFGKIVNMY